MPGAGGQAGTGFVIIKPSRINTGGDTGRIKPVCLWATKPFNLGQIDTAMKPHPHHYHFGGPIGDAFIM